MSSLTGTLTALAIVLGRVLRHATRNRSAVIRQSWCPPCSCRGGCAWGVLAVVPGCG